MIERCGWFSAASGVSWPAALELGDQRVVVGQLLELAVAQPVGAAVADVGEADGVVVDHRRGQGGAHPAPRLVALRELVDLPVGLAGRQPPSCCSGVPPASADCLEHVSAAIRDATSPAWAPPMPSATAKSGDGDDEVVLVGLALAPDVGQPGVFDDAQCHGGYSS